ncbi:lipopolysaccharide heptosyltransferase I [Klebsiella pneumoniae subsp. ozaenae]|uniref:Lipopolysaccharide heptosyltransferase I n=1 Tax=Klebsiella pneumoniae subsp. ozaenae TaxID=574 RepID=A0A377YUG0_KLEPO|nr:lipopolysaccharide heptosyltransferase I [Klebsiella pneumoniae subsp. ozaenae]
MRVLIVKTSSMGDVLHTLPALTDAAQAIPGIRFDWVVEEGFAQIPSWHKSVERVIPVAIRRWRKAWFSTPIKAERQTFREAVQAVKYDAIIDAQGLVKSAALVTRLAPRRQARYGLAIGPRAAGEPVLQPPPPYRETAARGWSVPVSCSPKALATRNPRPRGITPLRAIPAARG